MGGKRSWGRDGAMNKGAQGGTQGVAWQSGMAMFLDRFLLRLPLKCPTDTATLLCLPVAFSMVTAEK